MTTKQHTEILVTELKALRELRSKGFAVIVWTPEEIGNAGISLLEDIVIERGNEFLESWN